MLNAAYGMLAMLPVTFWDCRVRDGVAMTASWPPNQQAALSIPTRWHDARSMANLQP